MKTIIIITTLLASTCNKSNMKPEKFEVGVYFGSMCCGTADDEFLKPFYKKYSEKIAAYKIMGCGKEGEYRILFSAPGILENDLNEFVRELTVLTTKQDSVNRSTNATIGGMNIERNIVKQDYEYCRLPMEEWK